ncbi:thiopeptide-type bacteriocin biosynthesis protein [Actinosynnema pretiosum]|uniref:thiopeptide-type bacteriocin biosynthesis protein n=1 Tax=Actinosynnema pretiosum TaxID=42197 RepID=UPI003CD08AA8
MARGRAPIAHDLRAAHLPGAGPWVHAQLHAHPNLHTTLLTGHLPALLDRLAHSDPHHRHAPTWWFLPYHDHGGHHLRLRLATADEDGGRARVLAALGTWSQGLRERGLLATMRLENYRPELGRFGHGATVAAAKHAFAADSDAPRPGHGARDAAAPALRARARPGPRRRAAVPAPGPRRRPQPHRPQEHRITPPPPAMPGRASCQRRYGAIAMPRCRCLRWCGLWWCVTAARGWAGGTGRSRRRNRCAWWC